MEWSDVADRENGACVASERLVDHLPFERDRRLATRDGTVVGSEEPTGAVDLLGRRRERLVGERNLRRVDAELAGVSERAPDRASSRKAVSSPNVVTTWSIASTPAMRAVSATRERAYNTSMLDSVRTPPMSATKSSAPK